MQIRWLVLGVLVSGTVAQAAEAHEGYATLVGSCRGAKWNQDGWPKGQGIQTPEQCAALCAKAAGCTSFDLARAAQSDKFDCFLFGHREVVGEGTADTCFTKAPKLDFLEGAGACRGEGWNAKGWPKNEGLQTPEVCREKCSMTAGCTAYDLARPKAGKFECFLFGHKKLERDKQDARCFTAVPLPSYQALKGSCRGRDWKTKDWPKHLDATDLNSALAACNAMAGCTAIDVARLKDGKFDAYAFGHTSVEADGSPDACFKRQ